MFWKKAQPQVQSARSLAITELTVHGYEQKNIGKAAREIAHCLKQFFAHQYHWRSAELSDEELVKRLSGHLSPALRKKLKGILHDLEELRYASNTDKESLVRLADLARDLVVST